MTFYDLNQFIKFEPARINNFAFAEDARKCANELREDAKQLSALFTHIEENIILGNERLSMAVRGMIEDLRLKVLALAGDADDQAEGLEIEEDDERIYGSDRDQAYATYRAATL